MSGPSPSSRRGKREPILHEGKLIPFRTRIVYSPPKEKEELVGATTRMVEENQLHLTATLIHEEKDEHEDTTGIGNQSVLITSQPALLEPLLKHQYWTGQNFIRSDAYFSPPPKSPGRELFALHPMMKHSLRRYLMVNCSSLINDKWVTTQKLIHILTQIADGIIRAHNAGFVIGALSLDSIFCSEKVNYPIIKLDWQLESRAWNRNDLELFKKRDWKLFAALIDSILIILREMGGIRTGYEILKLQDYLCAEDINLTNVKEYINILLTLWGHKRIHFLSRFVEELNRKKNSRAREAIEECNFDILPIGHVANWKKAPGLSSIVSKMEDDGLDYNTRKFMSESGLDHTDTVLYAKSKKEVEGEGKHLYDPHSAVEYLRFYYNCISHCDSKKFGKSIYEFDNLLRLKQPRTVWTLYEIMKGQNLFAGNLAAILELDEQGFLLS